MDKYLELSNKYDTFIYDSYKVYKVDNKLKVDYHYIIDNLEDLVKEHGYRCVIDLHQLSYERIEDINFITYKALPYLRNVYYRMNDCRIDKSYSEIEHYVSEIYYIIKENSIEGYVNEFLNEDEKFKKYYNELGERYG